MYSPDELYSLWMNNLSVHEGSVGINFSVVIMVAEYAFTNIMNPVNSYSAEISRNIGMIIQVAPEQRLKSCRTLTNGKHTTKQGIPHLICSSEY